MTRFNMDHAEMERLLQSAGVEQSAAEVHGMLYGMICAGVPDWQAKLLSDNEPEPSIVDQLTRLQEATAGELQQRQMPLHLLLPEDERPAQERATAVRDWVQGFLYGFGLGGQQPQSLLESDAGEALRDFSEIARMDLEEFNEEQQAEEALMQLQEYLWVATSLIWHEMQNDAE